VVDPQTRTHHAVEYEMKTAAAPENAMAERRMARLDAGKFRDKDSDPQSSIKTDAITRIGIERRLL